MMKLSELAMFCRRMGTGLRSGVDILKLLDSESHSGNARHRAAMEEIAASIRKGDSLADAMKAQSSHFPNLLVQLVHASELSGRVESMFLYMADYYEQLKQTRSHFLQRITWPMIQLFMAVGVIGLVILLQAVLSPNTTYDASALGLRGYQGFVIYCLGVLTISGLVGLLVYGLWKNWFQCHRRLMPVVQRIPQLVTALETLGLSRLSVTLSMLLNAGVDARHAVKQAFLATGNHYFIGGMKKSVEEVSRGASFGDAFEKSQVLPKEFVDAVRTGEISGSETETLDYMTRQYQQRAAAALDTLATIASVVIWLGIVLLIGFMVLRMAFQYLNLLHDTIENPMGS
jgi:type II secretory pathway component PulF